MKIYNKIIRLVQVYEKKYGSLMKTYDTELVYLFCKILGNPI